MCISDSKWFLARPVKLIAKRLNSCRPRGWSKHSESLQAGQHLPYKLQLKITICYQPNIYNKVHDVALSLSLISDKKQNQESQVPANL